MVKRQHLARLVSVSVLVLLAGFMALSVPASGRAAYFCAAGYDIAPNSYCSDNVYNNQTLIEYDDQDSWGGGQYVAVFGVRPDGSWCCQVNGLGQAFSYPSSSYVRAFCWNRSNVGGYANIGLEGWCYRQP